MITANAGRRNAPMTVSMALLLAACGPEPAAPRADNTSDAASAPAAPVSAVPPASAARPASPTEPSAIVGPALALEGEGLRVFNPDTGAARPLPFGMAQAQLMAVLATRGEAETGVNGECGAGPLGHAAWPDGLTVRFQDDRFVGWSVDMRAAGKLTTADGVGPGSTRRALEEGYAATVEESTLGQEFTVGEMGGLLDGSGPEAKITAMWAGVTCHFR